ncbi:MAG: DegT/DnrJ/EryC1/StrS family aminotransferase [Solirubrobacteraceae bacterium]
MSWAIPLTDVVVSEEDVEAVLDCLRSGWLTSGPRTQAFEAALSDHLGGGHAVAVSSGTAALHLACRAIGLGPGDEAIVPAVTFVATAHAVRYCGAEPILCDVVGDGDLNLDVEDVARRIGPRTRAVLAVHFCGYAAEVEALRTLCDERGIALIEDAAQAIDARTTSGRPAGTVGHVGCFSFFSKKQLCVGEGGLVLSADEELAARCRSLRSHAMTSGTWDRHRGYADTYDIVDIGFNYRIDEGRAALGISRLARLEADIEARRDRVRDYRRCLAGVDGVALCWSEEEVERSSHFAFPVLLPDRRARDRFREALAEHGIQTTVYEALTRFSEFAAAAPPGEVTRAEEMADRHVALPLWAQMTGGQLDQVVRAVLDAAPAATSG